jgi:hypothetical protein
VSLVLLVAPTVMPCATAVSDGAKNALKNAHQSAHARIAGGVRLFKRILRFVLVLAQYRSSHAELTTDRATNPSSALSDLESPHTPLAARAILWRYSGRASSRAG